MQTQQRWPALAAMYAGLFLTIAAAVVPYLARATLAGHIRTGYPDYTPAQVDSAVTKWLVILTLLGALGALGWAGALWAAHAGRSWVRPAASVLFALGLACALTTLLIEDTSGEVGLAPLLGGIGLLPSLAGALAVVLLWTRPAPAA